MNIHQILFFCFLSALCGGHSGLVSAKLNTYVGPEGGKGLVGCTLTKSGSSKFFCKDECKAEDILIKTDEVRAQSGRYSTKYREDSSGKGHLSVTITHLTKSDSGRYRCGLGRNLVPDSYSDFEVRVVDATTLNVNHRFSRGVVEGEDITFGCLDAVNRTQKFLCRNECTKEEDILIETDENRAQSGRYSIEHRKGSSAGLYMTITRATKSDSGWYKCGYGRASSPESSYYSYIFVFDVTPAISGPKWTPPPSSASLPSASTPATTTQSVSSTSGSSTPSSVSPENTDQFTESAVAASSEFDPTADPHPQESKDASDEYLLPLVISVVVVVVVVVLLVAVVLLLRYERKTNRNSDDMNMERVTFENRPPVSPCEDSVYQNLNPATRDLDWTY